MAGKYYRALKRAAKRTSKSVGHTKSQTKQYSKNVGKALKSFKPKQQKKLLKANTQKVKLARKIKAHLGVKQNEAVRVYGGNTKAMKQYRKRFK